MNNQDDKRNDGGVDGDVENSAPVSGLSQHQGGAVASDGAVAAGVGDEHRDLAGGNLTMPDPRFDPIGDEEETKPPAQGPPESRKVEPSGATAPKDDASMTMEPPAQTIGQVWSDLPAQLRVAFRSIVREEDMKEDAARRRVREQRREEEVEEPLPGVVTRSAFAKGGHRHSVLTPQKKATTTGQGLHYLAAYGRRFATHEEREAALEKAAEEGRTMTDPAESAKVERQRMVVDTMNQEIWRLKNEADAADEAADELRAALAEAEASRDAARMMYARDQVSRDAQSRRILTVELSRQMVALAQAKADLEAKQRDAEGAIPGGKIKDLKNIMPPFTGRGKNGGPVIPTDALRYCMEVQARCITHGYGPNCYARVLASGLRDRALEWYMDWRKTHDDMKLNWVALCTAFGGKFTGGRTMLKREFCRMGGREGETIEELYKRVMFLGEALGYAGESEEVYDAFWGAMTEVDKDKVAGQETIGVRMSTKAIVLYLTRQEERQREKEWNMGPEPSRKKGSSSGRGEAVRYVGQEEEPRSMEEMGAEQYAYGGGPYQW